MDSVAAARANVALLAIVSLWRVVLMTRVLQVTTRAPFANALIWVLFAASIEVLVVFFFGGAFAKAIMAGMGGMRNSPEENIMLEAMGAAFVGALWTAPATFVLALLWTPKRLLQPLPRPAREPVHWLALAVATCFWVGVAVVPQRELANTVKVERFLANHQPRAALDVLASHQPTDFAPARTLPPKPFERSLFRELPECFGALHASDPEWVRKLMLSKLDTMISHAGPGYRRGLDATQPRAQQVQSVLSGLEWHGAEAGGLTNILAGLKRIPEGAVWIQSNSIFLEAAWQFATKEESTSRRPSSSVDPQSRMVLSNMLWAASRTNSGALPSTSPPPPVRR